MNSFNIICGPFLDLESVYLTKSFFNSIGCSNINYNYNFKTSFDFRFSFLVNATINGLEIISMCFFIGLNIRFEAPILSYRLRKNFLKNNGILPCFSLGLSIDYLTFPVLNFGNSSKVFDFILKGKFIFLKNFLLADFYCLRFLNYNYSLFEKFSIFLGSSCLYRYDSSSFIEGVSYFLFNYYFSRDF